MNDLKTMRYETQIQLVPSSMKKLNSQFALVDILLCYHGKNRNMTIMSKETIEKALPSLYGIPIVGEYIYLDDGSQDFGSHGGRIIIDDNGIKFEDTTVPYGFVTEDAVRNAKWVTITEKNGIDTHEYLELKNCIIWAERYEEVSALLDKNYGQSMEISITSSHYTDDGYSEIDEFTFSAACILGSWADGSPVIPCFESACIGRHYALDSFKKEFALMLDEYKKLKLETNEKEEKKIMDSNKLTAFLSAFTLGDPDNTPRYTLVGEQTENLFTVIDALENFKVYTVQYALDTDDKIVALWDEKVERKLSVVDYEADNAIAIGDVVDFKTMAEKMTAQKITDVTNELNASYGAQIQEKDQAYADLKSKYEVASSKLDEYQKAEIEAAKDAHRKEIDNIINNFADKLQHNAEFLCYKAQLNPDEVTVEEVNNKLVMILGKEMFEGKINNGRYSYRVQETKAMNSSTNKENDRYGDILDRWTK